MKSLVQRINESTLLDIKTYIRDEMQSDFTHALDILKNANSTTGLMLGVNNYIENVRNPLKNAGYYLAMLFELSGLNVHENINIIKNIIGNTNINELSNFTNKLLFETDKRKKNKNLIETFKEDLANSSNNSKTHTKNFLTNYCEGFETVAKYIFEINNFKKTGITTKNGQGELLLQLMFGNKTDKPQAGDIHVENMLIEVKGVNGRLGNSNINSSQMTIKFIDKLVEYNIISEPINTNESCFGGKREKGLRNSVAVFNKFWENISINTTVEKIETIIFKCYIETILSKYKIDNLSDEIIKNLEGKNPFIIENNKIKIVETHVNFVDLTGFIYLIGYQFIEQFKYLVVFDDDLNYMCFDCNNMIEKYNIITEYIKFVLPGNKDDKQNIDNVAKISLK